MLTNHRFCPLNLLSDQLGQNMNQPEMIVGLDIGGANIKAAVWLGDDQVRGASTNFPMWKQPDQLAAAVRALLKQLDASGNWP